MSKIKSATEPQPKRRGRKPSAFVRADDCYNGTSRVCYISIRGYVFAVFDADDLDIARGCCPLWDPRRGVYRIGRHATSSERATGRGSTVYAHQLVLERKLGRPRLPGHVEVVDHINSDTLDNRRSNLRALSHRLNTALGADVKTGLRLPGANYDSYRAASGRSQCWLAQWREPGQPSKHLGWFATELEAHLAWRARFDAVEPGALDAAISAHPALLERLALLSVCQ